MVKQSQPARGRRERPPEDVARARVFAVRLRTLHRQPRYGGLSDRAFAGAIGVEYETARQWLVDHAHLEPSTPGGATLAVIAQRTGVSLDWLLGLSGADGEPALRDLATGDASGVGSVAGLERALAAYVGQQLDAAQRAGTLPRVLAPRARESEARGALPSVGGVFGARVLQWHVHGADVLAATIARELAAARAHADAFERSSEDASRARALRDVWEELPESARQPVARAGAALARRARTDADAAWDGKSGALLLPSHAFGGSAPGGSDPP